LDPRAGVGAEGDAPAPPAADHPDAARAGGLRGARAHRPRRDGARRVAAGVEPDRGGLPEGRELRPRPLHRPPAGGPAEPLDVDPVRRRAAPLRRQRVRDDADEGDLLGHPARLHVRGGRAPGLVPGRLLEDGDPAPAAVPGAVPAPRPRVSRPMAVRVVHVATGNVGRIALSQLIEDPRFDLVGLVVSDPEKAGRDAGELAGTGTVTGVKATADLDAALAARPECTVYCALGETRLTGALADVRKILASGSNVVASSPV